MSKMYKVIQVVPDTNEPVEGAEPFITDKDSLTLPELIENENMDDSFLEVKDHDDYDDFCNQDGDIIEVGVTWSTTRMFVLKVLEEIENE